MVNKKLKEVFDVKIDDKEVKVAVKRPTSKDNAEARKEFNKAYAEAIASKAIIKGKVDKVLREQELWDDVIQKEFEDLNKRVQDNRKKLENEKIDLDLGKTLAEECKKDEVRLRELRGIRSSVEIHTADSQADNAFFNKLVSLCTVYDNNEKQVFSSLEDFLARGDEEVAMKAAEKMMFLYYGIDQNFEANLPENKFLAKLNKQEEVVSEPTTDTASSPAE